MSEITKSVKVFVGQHITVYAVLEQRLAKFVGRPVAYTLRVRYTYNDDVGIGSNHEVFSHKTFADVKEGLVGIVRESDKDDALICCRIENMKENAIEFRAFCEGLLS